MPPYPSGTASTLLFLLGFILLFFPSILSILLPKFLQPQFFSAPSYPTCSSSPPSPVPPASPTGAIAMSGWFQKTLTLPSRSRGSYLITDEITHALPEIQQYKVGILHLFIQHTSAALSMNENWDEDVREDMSDAMDRIVPEDKGNKQRMYRHSAEGSDDMPVGSLLLAGEKRGSREGLGGSRGV